MLIQIWEGTNDEFEATVTRRKFQTLFVFSFLIHDVYVGITAAVVLLITPN